MERLFESLTGIIVLLVIIATTINFAYLVIFGLGIFSAIVMTSYSYCGDSLAGWTIFASLGTACFATIFLLIVSIFFEPISIGFFLSAIGGTISLSIAVSAYLESKE
ncbi:MAG: hypothetical protein WC319_00375 [Candidatus Paceibacterota bacterium]|jgi:hypothetical protein